MSRTARGRKRSAQNTGQRPACNRARGSKNRQKPRNATRREPIGRADETTEEEAEAGHERAEPTRRTTSSERLTETSERTSATGSDPRARASSRRTPGKGKSSTAQDRPKGAAVQEAKREPKL
ncbi:hypothetical protein Tco_0386851 [Tanacetum coccineum]|uniref:Uncharacterized protein n=1 Tax=Tanacetum coccineum TaxID=301880 RepID=A0ABQ5DVG5_9ASTR